MPIHRDAVQGLGLAIVASSTSPLVLLDGDLQVVGASTSFFRAFHIDADSAPGRRLLDLGDGEWNVRQLHSLLDAVGSGAAEIDAYEMDLATGRGDPRRLVLNAQKLNFGDETHRYILLSVVDVTDARIAAKLKDDLLREKAILLQELQHRVANSLQIIASVILQSARKVSSDETRLHLTDAHNRVMSVASLQQQLTASRLGEVELRAYFRKLCDSIGASMIRDHDQLVLEVKADDSTSEADVSVSLGLIVTELVINCLKHAFPGGRLGKIEVGYESRGPNWTLSVADNGVGMPKDAASATPGLGTSIVDALAHQLDAKVRVMDAHPGTVVSVAHTQIAAVADEDESDLPQAAG
ncbi:sensor histidine kinase [Phenylobacterium sp.]|uniref:sensor histidine kinase n=1 Tax=Phenylobacterium sp. TaxID=1871053 RepID=UPI00272F39F3|nr:histidine kinase dimerization/phosphoacceptor domain -containing protein [Phenylobacterium sp.]MDP2213593.1 histidine kinase dimerization/phosphoacceptor domain -containing protein [Phenylobacterium sp.]